jgi:hypothetical protein
MKRKAFIGLSSPTAYYYDHEQKFFKEKWRWNPILESPQGLITLFDEIWFLSRALCPVNLRSESYVKFLDEDSDYIPLIKNLSRQFRNSYIDGLIIENPLLGEIINLDSRYPDEQFKRYNEVIRYVYGREANSYAPLDNHSHGIDLCGTTISGNSMRLDLLAYDITFLSKLGVQNIELITNRFNSTAFHQHPKTLNKIQTSQNIIIKRIPVLQSPMGPVIERIEDIRENNFLIDFRAKIISSSNTDIIELVPQIEKEFQDYRNNVLIGKQKSSKVFTSIAKNAVSFLLGNNLPLGAEVKSLIDDHFTRKMNWTGFLSEIELKTSKS